MTVDGLRKQGTEVIVVTSGASDKQYRFDGTDVYVCREDIARHHWSETGPAEDSLSRVLSELGVTVLHVVSQAGAPTVIRTANRMGIPVGMAGMDYGLVCERRTLLRGGGDVCPGFTSADDCFTCKLESVRTRDRMLARFGKQFPESINGLVARIGTRIKGRSFGQQLDWWKEIEYGHRLRKEVLGRLDIYVGATAYSLEQVRRLGNGNIKTYKLMYPLQDDLLHDEIKNTPNDRLVLGFLGRPWPMKGLDILVEAVETVASSAPVQLTCFCPRNYGEFETYWGGLKQRVENLNHGAWTDPGLLDADQLRQIHRGIDVLVVPSIWPEYLGFVTIEALALGTPVILSDLPPQLELVEEQGRDGWTVAPGDPAALATAIKKAWELKRTGKLPVPRSIAMRTTDYAKSLLEAYGIAY